MSSILAMKSFLVFQGTMLMYPSLQFCAPFCLVIKFSWELSLLILLLDVFYCAVRMH